MKFLENLLLLGDFQTAADPIRRMVLKEGAKITAALFLEGHADIKVNRMASEPAIVRFDLTGFTQRFEVSGSSPVMVLSTRIVIDPFKNPDLADATILLGMTNEGMPPRISGLQYFNLEGDEIGVPLGYRGQFTPFDMGHKYGSEHAAALRRNRTNTFITTSALVLREPADGTKPRAAQLVTPRANRKFDVTPAVLRRDGTTWQDDSRRETKNSSRNDMYSVVGGKNESLINISHTVNIFPR